MPYLMIQTNVELIPASRDELLRTVSTHLSELLGKPESYIMVALEDGTSMLFAGSDEPLAYLELKSLGLPEASTARFSEGLCALIGRELGIPSGRVYIEFTAPARHMWGWNGATF